MPSVSRFAFGFGALFVTLLVRGESARAQAPKREDLQVLEIDSDDADDEAEALTGGLRSRVRSAPGWALPETTQSLRMLTAALRCPKRPDPACLQHIGDHLKADRFVWGTLSKAGGRRVTADVHLWTRGKPDIAVQETYSDNLKDASDDTLRKIATRIMDRLIGGPGGGEPTSALGFVAAPGPGADVHVDPAPDASALPAEATPGRSSSRTTLAWTGIIGGGALLVAGGVLGIVFESSRSKLAADRQNNYGNVGEGATIQNPCDPPPGESNATTSSGCHARDVAQAVIIPEIAALGAGAALAVAGIALLATDHKRDPSRDAGRGLKQLTLLPQFDARGASLRLSASF